MPTTTLAKRELEKCEAIIKKGVSTWMETSVALQKIHANGLYKEAGYDTFAEYCEQRWGFSKRRGYQLMVAANLVHRLGVENAKLLTDERAARALREVPVDEQAELLEELVGDGKVTMKRGVKKVTAKAIKTAAAKRKSAPNKASTDGNAPAPPAKPVAEEMIDALGTVIKHKRVALAFQEASQLTELIALVHKVKRQVIALANQWVGVHVPKQHLESDLKNVIIALRHGIPFAVCPKCEGAGTKCPACRKAGWITKPMWKRVPENM